MVTDFDESQGVNLLTLVPIGLRRWRRFFGLKLLKYEFLIAARRAVPPSSDVVSAAEFLEGLGVVHFGRWVMIRRLPRFRRAGQPREMFRWSYLLFMSNFNAGWRGYVDMFSESLGGGLEYLWGSTPGWVGPEDDDGGTEAFLRFVNNHVIEHQHYYAAYPFVSTADVKAALHVDREVRSFANTPPEDNIDQWFAAYETLVRRVQHSLGEIKGVSVTEVTAAESVPASRPTGLSMLCPFPKNEPGMEETKLQYLCKIEDQPFALVPGTHFARLGVLERVYHYDVGPVDLESGYLLFAADVDGTKEEYLARMYEKMGATRINRIWEGCYGFDPEKGCAGFVAYMKKCSFAATLPFADYPFVSEWDVVRALKTHAWFTDHVFATVNCSPGDVKTRFEEHSMAPSPREMGS